VGKVRYPEDFPSVLLYNSPTRRSLREARERLEGLLRGDLMEGPTEELSDAIEALDDLEHAMRKAEGKLFQWFQEHNEGA